MRRYGKHVAFVFDSHARGGMFKPEIHLHRSGKNGSPAGFGPKAWPWLLLKLFPHGWGRGWDSMLRIPLPYLPWARAYQLRRFGGLKVYSSFYTLYRRAGRVGSGS